MTDRLFINNQEVDLSPGTVIALTFQINDLSDLKDRQANLSNQFKVPKTKTNALIFESCELVQSTSVIPYQKSPAKVSKDGIDLYGVAIIQNTTEVYNVVFYSGLFDFFALIDGLKLKDVDLSAYDHWFEFASVQTTRTATAGYKYPIIDYGGFNNTTRNVDWRQLRPSVFVHTVIDKIFSTVGVAKSGALFSDADYLKLLSPFSNDIFNVPPQLKLANTGGNFYALVTSTENWTFTIDLTLTVTSWTDGNSFLEIGVQVGLTFTALYTHPDSGFGGGAGVFVLSLPINFVNTSDVIKPYFHAIPNTAPTAGTFTGSFSGIEANTGTRFKVKIADGFAGLGIAFRNIPYSLIWVYVQDTLPDMTQADFLKGIFNFLFAAIYKSDSFRNEIIFTTFKSISDNRAIAKDWSDKLHDEQGKELIDYHATSYAQKSYLKYKADSNDKDIIASIYDSFFLIADQTLAPEKVVVQSPFAATIMEKMLQDLDVPLIRKINNGNFEISTAPRLLIDDTQNITGAPITFINTSLVTNNDIPMCYFSLVGKSFNLDYAFIKAAFFTELIACLQDYRKTIPQFIIKATDINELDHFIPVYVSKYNQYFYLNKIINWKEPEPTKTEIIRI